MVRIVRRKEIKKNNIFGISFNKNSGLEIAEEIIKSGGIKIERILSTGQTTPEGKWLKGNNDEWVILLKGKAELLFYNNQKMLLKEGDYIFIPHGCKHRVTYTSRKPHCVWLAVHAKFID
jgi:cupin 2 domain-containing protein